MNRTIRLFPGLAICACIGAGLGVGAFSIGAAEARPIEQELQFLIDSHPKIRESEKTVESRRAAIMDARALYYPRVSVTGDVGREVVSTPASRRRGEGDPSSDVAKTLGLTIKQNLFDGFATTSQVHAAQINREVSELSLEGTRQNTLFEGIRAYVDVLRQRRLVEISRENEHTIQRQLNLEDERVRRGSGVTQDVLTAKSRLQVAIERRVSFEGALANAISTYEQVFGHAPDIATMIDPAPPAEVIPSTQKRVTEIALMENPALIGGAAKVELALEQRRGTSSAFLPKVDLEGTANYENDLSAVDGVRRDYGVKLSASWDVFNGGSSTARQDIRHFDYQAAMDGQDYTISKVIEQSRLAWQSLITSRTRKELLGNAVNIAAELFEQRKKLRDAGKETIINVLDQENELNNTQINYATATYNERVAIYQVLLSMGRLMPEYMISQR